MPKRSISFSKSSVSRASSPHTPERVAYHARRMVWRLVTSLEGLGEWMEAWRLLPLRT